MEIKRGQTIIPVSSEWLEILKVESRGLYLLFAMTILKSNPSIKRDAALMRTASYLKHYVLRTVRKMNVPSMALLFVCSISAFAGETDFTPREKYTCDKEAKFFSSWQSLAGGVNLKKIQGTKAEFVSVRASDNRTLRGLLLPAIAAKTGAILVLPGNAWLAEDFLPYAKTFTANGLDVYIFDYRGYGLSNDANSTITAIIDDYKEIGQWLKSKQYNNLYLYAFSFGGVVAANAFQQDSPFKAIVLDAVPSRPNLLLGIKCSTSYSPVDAIRSPCAEVTFMHGTSDWVIGRGSTEELISKIKSCGGTLDIEKWRGHPFQIEWDSTIRARLRDVMTHLDLKLIEEPEQ